MRSQQTEVHFWKLERNSAVTNQQINQRIARLCGWNRIETGFGSQWSERFGKLSPPNYAESLDACREFTSQLDPRLFSDVLKSVIQDNRCVSSALDARYLTAQSTAIEQCEAFLRMKGEWEQ